VTGPLGMDSAAGVGIGMAFQSAGSWRWTFGKNSTPESGGNAGSHFTVGRYSDAGGWLDDPLSINRTTGVVGVTDGLVIGASSQIIASPTDGISITNPDRLRHALKIARTQAATTVNDAEIFRVDYMGKRATWTNEKGNLRTSNEESKAEVAMKIIGASQAEGGTGNMFEVLDLAGNVQTRIGVLGRQNFYKGLRLVGDTFEIRDSTEVDTSTIAQPLSGDLTITPKKGLTVTKKITAPASATAQASVNIPHGAAPTTPANGDMWTTSAGLFIRINGVTKTVTLT
jgi:hypothetical protein